MQPTFNPDRNGLKKDWVILDKTVQYTGRYSIGDVVFLTSPGNPDMKLIKRIVALEGDAVRPRRGLEEGVGNWGWKIGMDHNGYIKIPRGYCWVESDESFRGMDSNTFGPIPLGLVESRVAYVIWPPERLHAVERKLPKVGRVLKSHGFTFDIQEADDAQLITLLSK
ncbi:peptidase S24/S26A/S26B/S26C [Gaertneriomyces semiglobifer]|nr:peptidase S24/S26A/S26B/S26C [Gaertneriomyces semiglobifer]